MALYGLKRIAERLALGAKREEVWCRTGTMSHVVVRRAPVRETLKPVKCLARAAGEFDPARWPVAARSEGEQFDPSWAAIVRVSDGKGYESFEVVFLREDGAVATWQGFDTLLIARGQAHAAAGIEYVEWEPCEIELANEDGSIEWERAVPATAGAGET